MILAEIFPARHHESWRWSDLGGRSAGWAPVAKDWTEERRRAFESARVRGDVIGQLAGAFGDLIRREVHGRTQELVAPQSCLCAEELIIERDAMLDRVILQAPGAEPWLLRSRVTLNDGAQFRQFVLALGAPLARHELTVDIVGTGARVELSGVYLCGNGAHADLTSQVTHAAPESTTVQNVRGAARRGGRGVFQGRIDVATGARSTDARQHHAGLMLSDGAEIFAKPELRIACDDVQCAHGSTVGTLDEQALFYMRSRGLPDAKARALLVKAFLFEAIPDWLNPDVRDAVSEHIQAWLETDR